jgi:hypothetical protein
MQLYIWAGVAAIVLVVGASADEKAGHKDGAKNANLEKLKKLAGEWVAVGADGKPTTTIVSVFKVTAAGSAVHETIFPGSPHEMVSVYHLDGKDLLMTHYCAAGNQPRMKLDPKGKDNELKFTFAGGTNLDPAKDMHMHEGSITILDDDHIQWSWVGYMDGKPVKDHHVSMKLARKKK